MVQSRITHDAYLSCPYFAIFDHHVVRNIGEENVNVNFQVSSITPQNHHPDRHGQWIQSEGCIEGEGVASGEVGKRCQP